MRYLPQDISIVATSTRFSDLHEGAPGPGRREDAPYRRERKGPGRAMYSQYNFLPCAFTDMLALHTHLLPYAAPSMFPPPSFLDVSPYAADPGPSIACTLCTPTLATQATLCLPA